MHIHITVYLVTRAYSVVDLYQTTDALSPPSSVYPSEILIPLRCYSSSDQWNFFTAENLKLYTFWHSRYMCRFIGFAVGLHRPQDKHLKYGEQKFDCSCYICNGASCPRPGRRIYVVVYRQASRSRWEHGLRRGSAAARLLGLRVRIPPEVWMSVSCECCVCSDRGLCDGTIPCPEDFYRVRVCVWVWLDAIITLYT